MKGMDGSIANEIDLNSDDSRPVHFVGIAGGGGGGGGAQE